MARFAALFSRLRRAYHDFSRQNSSVGYAVIDAGSTWVCIGYLGEGMVGRIVVIEFDIGNFRFHRFADDSIVTFNFFLRYEYSKNSMKRR